MAYGMNQTSYSGGSSSPRASFTFKLTAPLDRDLFSDQAERAALVCTPLGKGEKNKSSQIRRFYDEIEMWAALVKGAPDREAKFREIEPYVQMLRAKAAYAKARSLIDDNFHDMLGALVNEIRSAESLENAKLFFEAFLGFKKFLEA